MNFYIPLLILNTSSIQNSGNEYCICIVMTNSEEHLVGGNDEGVKCKVTIHLKRFHHYQELCE